MLAPIETAVDRITYPRNKPSLTHPLKQRKDNIRTDCPDNVPGRARTSRQDGKVRFPF